MTFHPEILDEAQPQVLRQLSPMVSPRHFYLGGGTALALHLGHRHSVDLDRFTAEKIADPLRLAQDMRDEGSAFITGNVERGTLHGSMEGVRLSFMEFHYHCWSPSLLGQKSAVTLPRRRTSPA
jgi:hypothetical protein